MSIDGLPAVEPEHAAHRGRRNRGFCRRELSLPGMDCFVGQPHLCWAGRLDELWQLLQRRAFEDRQVEVAAHLDGAVVDADDQAAAAKAKGADPGVQTRADIVQGRMVGQQPVQAAQAGIHGNEPVAADPVGVVQILGPLNPDIHAPIVGLEGAEQLLV